jgi:hypothetical protein
MKKRQQKDCQTVTESTIPGGFIICARKTIESEIMDKPPLYIKLWIWMLIRASYKDGNKLKRGQFFTSTKEMQEAMSYKIGYRKQTPTRGQIRSAYEAFMNDHRISTTKSTRGMLITICNYDTYQNPENYEAPYGAPYGRATNNQVATQDSKERKERKNKETTVTEVFLSDSNEIRLAKYLFNLILKNNPNAKKPNFQKWAKEFNSMIRIDRRKLEDIKELVGWCQKDPFWRTNILSPKKLRKQYDQLWVKKNYKNKTHDDGPGWQPPIEDLIS